MDTDALTPPVDSTSEREERLDGLVLAYLQSQRAGAPLSRKQLLSENPDLVDDLEEFFADQDKVERVAAPLRILTANQPQRGQKLGDYELIEIVAEGGMGVVYRARQRSLNRLVALKMVRANVLAGPLELLRFKAEAELVALLDHPNIVPVYEVGQWEGRPFFTMKFIEGGPLSSWLKNSRSSENVARLPHVDWKKRAEILAIVARAIHYAHQRGLLHRDIKPANILIDEQGQPHVTDFGLAKRLETAAENGQGPTPPDAAGLTQTGAILGTPAYMAPELAGGSRSAATVACDVYGLGAVLYEMLTGEPPFRGPTPLDTLLALKEKEPVRPRQLDARAPRDLETICLKCLTKEPAQRYPTALALAEDLARFQSGEPIQARRTGPLGRLSAWARRKPFIAGLTAALILSLIGGAALFAWQWYRAENFARQEQRQAEAADQSFQLAHEAIFELCETLNKPHAADSPALKAQRRELLEMSLAYYQRLLEVYGDDPRRAKEVARTHFRIASIAATLGSAEQALAAFEHAVEKQKALLALVPDWPEAEFDLARMYHELGYLQGRISRPKEALASYEEGRKLLDHVAAGRADSDRVRKELGLLYRTLAGWHRSHGKTEDALALLEKSRDTFRKLGGAARPDPTVLAWLANVHHDLALLHLARREPSMEDFWAAAALREQLVCVFPRNVGYQRDLAETYRHLGGYRTVDKKWDEAFALLERQHTLLEGLLRFDPGSRLTRSELAASYRQIGHLHRDKGDTAKALKCYEEAVDLNEELLRQDPSVTAYQNDLAKSYYDLSTAYGRQKRFDKAREVLLQSLSLRRKIVEGNPDHLGYRADLAYSLGNLGQALCGLDDHREGLKYLMEAQAERRRLVDQAPSLRSYRELLARSCSEVLKVQHRLGEWDKALATCLVLRDALPTSGPDLANAACAMGRTANLVKGKKDRDDLRRRLLDEAMATLDRAVAAGWSDRARLAKDADLAALRGRPDFKTLSAKMK